MTAPFRCRCATAAPPSLAWAMFAVAVCIAASWSRADGPPTDTKGKPPEVKKVEIHRLSNEELLKQAGAIYELLGMAEEGATEPAEWVRSYEAGLDAYARRDWAGAIELFQAVLAAHGSDRPSEIFIERCRNYIVSPPPEHWRAVSALAEK